jgi:hypothetical protein
MGDTAPRLDAQENTSEGAGEPAKFDYSEAAELFTHVGMIARARPSEESPAENLSAPARMPRRRGIAYRRFATSAEAVRFAIEELPPGHLLASVLVVNGDRYEGATIKDFYASPDYPLAPRIAAKRSRRAERR